MMIYFMILIYCSNVDIFTLLSVVFLSIDFQVEYLIRQRTIVRTGHEQSKCKNDKKYILGHYMSLSRNNSMSYMDGQKETKEYVHESRTTKAQKIGRRIIEDVPNFFMRWRTYGRATQNTHEPTSEDDTSKNPNLKRLSLGKSFYPLHSILIVQV